MADSEPDRDGESPAYQAQQARQGRIVLNTPARRTIFIAGLAGLVFVSLLLALT